MKNTPNRARRRYARARMIAKARRIYPDCDMPQRLADNLKKCSCWMCGNPRKRTKERGIKDDLHRFKTTDWD